MRRKQRKKGDRTEGAHACRKSGTRMHPLFLSAGENKFRFLPAVRSIPDHAKHFSPANPISRPVAPISGQQNISEQSNQFSAQSPQFPGSERFSEITNHIPNRKSRTAAGKFVNRRKRK